MRLEHGSNSEKIKKLWTENVDWAVWLFFIGGRIDGLMVVEDDPVFLWNEFKNLLLVAFIVHIPLKCYSNQSKLFWITDLTNASNEHRLLRKKDQVQNNIWEGTKHEDIEGTFQFSTREREFWTSYETLAITKHDEVGLIRYAVRIGGFYMFQSILAKILNPCSSEAKIWKTKFQRCNTCESRS